MNEKTMYGIIGLLGGIIIAWLFASSAVNNQSTGMMRMMGMRGDFNTGMMNQNNTSNMHGAMEDMMGGIMNKSGDEFDQAFIDEMIEHHQGAINMARLAEQNAKHQEIKDLAKDIIEAQTKEIQIMNQWKADWYK